MLADPMVSWLDAWWPYLTAGVGALELVAAGHAVLWKREPRAAIAWVAIILLVPLLGLLLYIVFGINRIRRAGARLREAMPSHDHASAGQLSCEQLAAALDPADAHVATIARTVEQTGRWPLLPGNQIAILDGGDRAYAEMLGAIAAARHAVALASYIFDNDPAGRRFVDALADARARGVEVRVLIDDAGARYSWPSIDRALRRRGVPVARFLPVWAPWSVAFVNLRSHRKILVVDGAVAFTGGMNIRQGCVLAESPRHPTRDVHFKLEGPIVEHLMDVFGEDWRFATREVLPARPWYAPATHRGPVVARVITDGPDRDLDCMRWAFLGALASARRSVRVVTPYFLPDEPLVTALNSAALRGVTVDIAIPRRGNLRVVNWAMRGEVWKVLRHGCRVWLTPPPFDHAKLMTVDGIWSLFGSANWDPRSLRLNFELGIECYDRTLARDLEAMIDHRIADAHRLTAAELAADSLPARLRNAAARLLAPYL